jgi:spore coat polysaccharide biosynthesis predicted glycosyltransferase SpsG
MRCIALAEEFARRRWRVVFCTDDRDVPWARGQLRDRGYDVVPPSVVTSSYPDLADGVGADVVVLDSYLLGPEVYASLRDGGRRTVAIVDGPPDHRPADLYVNQNLTGTDDTAPRGSRLLAGPAYALLRADVLRAVPSRRARARHRRRAAARPFPRVVAVLGGTDPFSVAPLVVAQLAMTGVAFDLTVVAAQDSIAREIEAICTSPGQHVTVVPPSSQLPALAVTADLVISAAGTSLLELLHLGVPTGVVAVADNQLPGYHALTATGAVMGLGTREELTVGSDAADRMSVLLRDQQLRERLRTVGPTLVDGRGRVRVVDAALAPLEAEVAGV